MVLSLLVSMSTAAYAAITAYNRMSRANPAGLTKTVSTIRQVTGVVLTLGTAIRGVLDALALVQRSTAPAPAGVPSSQGTGSSIRFPRED